MDEINREIKEALAAAREQDDRGQGAEKGE